MAKRKTKAAKVELSPSVASVKLPKRNKRDPLPSVGPEPTNPTVRSSPLKTKAKYAAEKSDLFPKGGEAFEKWCASQGISPRERRTSEEWSALLEEFASRPIHGLRRGPDGGNHRANKSSLRR